MTEEQLPLGGEGQPPAADEKIRNEPEVVPPTGGLTTQRDLIQKESLGGTETQLATQVAAESVATTARALVEARVVMALKRPRSWDGVRRRVLDDCKRKGFAKKARYSKPVGGQKVRGFTIRFAESAVRAMGNVLTDSDVIYEGPEFRIVRVTVMDLESNSSWLQSVIVDKTVERKKAADDGSYISARRNKQNEIVYRVPATDDDLLNKTNNLIAKALRNGILRLLPSDIQDEAEEAIATTLNSAAAEDPAAERKAIVDNFAKVGVSAEQLEVFLGHALSGTSAAELVELREVYTAVRDGEARWSEFVQAHADVSKSRVEELKDQLRGPKKGDEKK